MFKGNMAINIKIVSELRINALLHRVPVDESEFLIGMSRSATIQRKAIR